MSKGTKESDVAIIGTINPIFDVVIRSCANSIIQCGPNSWEVLYMNGVEETFDWNGVPTRIEAMHPNRFVR